MYVSDPMADVAPSTLIKLVYPKFQSTPGTKYAYSNTGYLLAQEVVAARSASRSFAAEIDRIIASVGLKNTYYTSNLYPVPIADRVVAGYYENDDPGFSPADRQERHAGQPAGRKARARSSRARGPHGLGARTLSGNDAATAKAEGGTAQPDLDKDGEAAGETDGRLLAGFGLGVASRFMPAFGAFWFYEGETLGFRAAHLYFPDSDLVVAIFANSRPTQKNSDIPQPSRKSTPRSKRTAHARR